MATTKKPADLAGLRAARLPLLAERAQLQAEHRGQDEARAEVATFTRGAAAEAHQRLGYAVSSGDFSLAFGLRARPDGVIDAGPLLAALLGADQLAAALEPHVLALPPSVDHPARLASIAAIAEELDALEEAEEVEVCRLEAQGLNPGRRADASPAVVLKLRGA